MAHFFPPMGLWTEWTEWTGWTEWTEWTEWTKSLPAVVSGQRRSFWPAQPFRQRMLRLARKIRIDLRNPLKVGCARHSAPTIEATERSVSYGSQGNRSTARTLGTHVNPDCSHNLCSYHLSKHNQRLMGARHQPTARRRRPGKASFEGEPHGSAEAGLSENAISPGLESGTREPAEPDSRKKGRSIG